MPSFDVVSEVDMHELSNAVDQASREIANRFDFKGVKASFELTDNVILLTAESDFQLRQMMEILRLKLAKREIDVASLQEDDVEITNSSATQKITVRQGLDAPLAKKLVKLIKEKKLKVQSAIQGDKLRVTGKKRDDLQAVMSMLHEADVELPLQYNNFRD